MGCRPKYSSLSNADYHSHEQQVYSLAFLVHESHQTKTRPVPAPVKGKKGKSGCIRHDDGDNDVGKEEENSDEEEAEGEDRA